MRFGSDIQANRLLAIAITKAIAILKFKVSDSSNACQMP